MAEEELERTGDVSLQGCRAEYSVRPEPLADRGLCHGGGQPPVVTVVLRGPKPGGRDCLGPAEVLGQLVGKARALPQSDLSPAAHRRGELHSGLGGGQWLAGRVPLDQHPLPLDPDRVRREALADRPQEAPRQERLALLVHRRVTQYEPPPRPGDELEKQELFVPEPRGRIREREPGLAQEEPIGVVQGRWRRTEAGKALLPEPEDEEVIAVEVPG